MKTVVITGAGKGIGLATVKKFLENGWRVLGTYYGTKIPLSSAMLTEMVLDLSSQSNIVRVAQEIKKIIPTVDVLINNAGILLDSADNSIDMEKVRKTFEVDLFGLIDFTERLIPLMHSGSHIINLDSGYGSMSEPIDDSSSNAYRLAKAALNMYTRVAAFRLKKQGIIVSSLAPGWVKTDMGYSVASDTQKPDREPEETAVDIYKLATSQVESGFFWEYGKKRKW